MPSEIVCPSCGSKYAPVEGGRCARCGAPAGAEAGIRPAGAGRGARRAFAHEAARASWLVPLAVAVLSGMVRRAGLGLFADLLVMLFVLAGLVLAIVALAGIGTHGRKGILLPALAGLFVNGLLILIFVSNVLALRG
jgi:hypothetical protein